jgi:uncharacterized OB-fold protein
MMSDNADTFAPAPEITELNRPYWDELVAGALTFQRCRACGCAWLPVRSECPQCLADDWGRERAAGGATLVSWVVYHHAYHPAFAQRLPYVVAVVQLDEGPRMISNVVGSPGDGSALAIDMRLRLSIEREGDVSVPRFAPA